MKTITQQFKFLFIAVSFILSCSICKAQTWQWAKNSGGNSNTISYSVATNSAGQAFMVGAFASSSITFGAFILNNAQQYFLNVFVVKYDALGSVLWARGAGGPGHDEALAVDVDAGGNVVVAGYFESPTIIFGTDTLTNTSSAKDIFIVKYDPNGNVLWAKSIKGENTDYNENNSIATDAANNILVCGYFASDTLTLGTTTLINENPNGNSGDLFIFKLDANGNTLWGKRADGYGDGESAYSISTDFANNVLVAGLFGDSMTIDSYTVYNSWLGGFGNDIFVLKLDAAGNTLWVNSAGGAIASEEVHAVGCDASGAVVIAGNFANDVEFGLDTVFAGLQVDVFVAKYDANGNVLWAESAGGNGGTEIATSLAIEPSGNIYVAGSFGSPTFTFASTTMTNASIFDDIFVLKYTSSGSPVWAKSAGGNNDDIPYSIALDASLNFFLAGEFNSNTLAFGSTTLTRVGPVNLFIAKHSAVTGIEDMESENFISLFPNPATNELRIENSKFSIKEIEIYNILGEKVHSQQPETSNTKPITVNVSELTPGIYFVKIRDEKGVQAAGKFIKM